MWVPRFVWLAVGGGWRLAAGDLRPVLGGAMLEANRFCCVHGSPAVLDLLRTEYILPGTIKRERKVSIEFC